MKRAIFAVAAVMGLIVVGSAYGQDSTTLLSYFLNDLRAGFVGVTLPTGFKATDGAAAAPSVTFASAPTNGLFMANSAVNVATAGTAVAAFYSDPTGLQLKSTYQVGWSSGSINAGNDVVLTRATTGALQVAQTSTTAAELRVSAGNGSYGGLITANESLTIAAAATTDSATTIPAGSIILAVAVRVTTVIPTAATFTVTAATGGNTFNTAAVSTAANTTDKGTAAGALYTSAGTKVRITPNLTPGAATGVVRLTIFYFNPNAPTS